ncbi:MAG TPA: transcriptional regulator NrdR [Kiritimatiellia bacterium]|nr:transcriptional regulator NrdR [Kiritimatiellia bacterium]
MRCPKCGHQDDKVIDSRAVRNGDVIRRRRICIKCSYRFTTYEEVVKATLRVIKRDSRHEEFDKKKLMSGIERACEKRPISAQQIEAIVDNLISELESEYEREVPSIVIGKKVMDRLEKMDEIAYVRFASVYRRFRDVNQFLSEVEGLIGRQ